MARKTQFETVPVAKIAHLAVRESTDGAPSAPPTVLCISQHRDLLLTRELILSRAGYRVCSVLKLEEAIRECAHKKFDLVVIGHSLLDGETSALEFLCQALANPGQATPSSNGHKISGTTPILLLRRPHDPHLQGADYELDPLAGPEALLKMVDGIFKRTQGPASRSGS
jgi:PleD family two-component response regulator